MQNMGNLMDFVSKGMAAQRAVDNEIEKAEKPIRDHAFKPKPDGYGTCKVCAYEKKDHQR